MIRTLPHLLGILAIVCASASAGAEPANRVLPASDSAAVRCSAAFAIVAGQQARGSGVAYPPLQYRGREYMAATGGTLFDKGWSEDEVAQAMRRAASGLQGEDLLDAVMPPCLDLLDAQVPPLQVPNLPQCTAIVRRMHDDMVEEEGASPRSADLLAQATALEQRTRQEAIAQGRTDEEVDAILGVEAASVAEVAGMPGGLARYDASACFDLAKIE